MIVLGIDTATPRTSLALATALGPIGSVGLVAPRGRHEVALTMLDQLSLATDTSLDQIAGVAVGVGPGLFTGLRVGVEIARTLSQVLNVPIIGVSSLDILAFSVRSTRRQIAALIDARRGEVFFARYQPVPGGVQRLTEPVVLSPDAAAAEIQATGEETLVVGNGAMLYRATFDQAGTVAAPDAQGFPEAATLVELTLPRFEREEHDQPERVVPFYLRKSDAEIAWDNKR